MESDFVNKVKKIVKNNFNQSIEIYSNFEKKYNFFYNLTIELAKFVNIKNNSKVLDAGCGIGYSMKAIYDNFTKDVYGIDISDGMINYGKKIFPEFTFIIGDVAKIDKYFDENFFNYVLFNLVVFILPDIETVFKNSFKILKDNGTIAFSFYPEIIDENGNDLFIKAFKNSNFILPKKQVISTYEICLESLENSGFKDIAEKKFEMNLDIEFLKDFFSIPAQSASLFPKLSYEERKKNVEILFDGIKNYENNGKIIWKLVKGVK